MNKTSVYTLTGFLAGLMIGFAVACTGYMLVKHVANDEQFYQFERMVHRGR